MADETLTPFNPAKVLAESRQNYQSELEDRQLFTTYRGLRKFEVKKEDHPKGLQLLRWLKPKVAPKTSVEPVVDPRIYANLKTLEREQKEEEGYLDVLPTFEGRNFLELVTDLIQKRKDEAVKNGQSYEKVVIVDLGFGQGRFLLDCYEKWGDDVELIGYGTDRYTKQPATMQVGLYTVEFPPTHQALLEAGIKTIEGNLVDLRQRLGDNQADLVVSSYALMYVQYPRWEMFKKIYRVLKPEGIAFLDQGLEFSELQFNPEKLSRELSENGYKFEFHPAKTSFQKTKSDIDVPIGTQLDQFNRKVIKKFKF
jgi:ubiquinone/menaquinone biosynthesis C-methylase UbiE